ncbi:MAG: chemotaxis protein CheB [Aquabacterium sp.]|nr:MAG: chemotaxis protein CheB [Aquabacterium sp.]
MPSHAPDASPRDPATSIRVVGLGASAGGLEALEQFLAKVPPDSGLAYVVVQHLDPTHKTMLAELLQRSTPMPVREAAEFVRIEPDVVYVIPPNAELTVVEGVLRLARPRPPRGMRLPVDVLFGSLARDQGEAAIGVVLSGMGRDGTLGLQAIKAQGGLTLVQDPASAQFDSMPRSAIDARAADIVALAGEMPAHILRVASASPPPALPAAGGATDAPPLNAILALLWEHCRHDLTLHKPSTLTRRIERRVAVHGLGTMAAYAAFLQHNPEELDFLFKEMLIGVTSFFRDPGVWAELRSTLVSVLKARPAGPTCLRSWIAGCSTGEEAYSLAMVFKEAIAELPEGGHCTLQIFATDLSAEAITVARRGCYPASIAAEVGTERLARFFNARSDGFQVAKEIREMVLFAQHDVILDPPFTRLDILSCRNLMIYFSTALQRRLISLFHYSLRPGGLLLLGGSETVGRSQTMFLPLCPKSRLYRRSDNAAGAGPVDFPVNRRSSMRPPAQEQTVSQSVNRPVNLQPLADQLLLQRFSPPAVLVNASGDIVYVSGRTGKYLEPAAGKANWNIHVMARPGIRTQLAAALRRTAQDGKTVELPGLRLEGETEAVVDVTVQAVAEPKALEGMVMIVFRDAPPASGAAARRRPAAGRADSAAQGELLALQEEMRALREEMRASEEELQAANEELQSTNEELQSANEELTTSKEEAQSMNEELQTINAELQTKLDDLALAQSDMQNLLNSTDIATLFLDGALNVRRFTEKITRIIHLRDGDIGRPLSELASTLIYPELHADSYETLRTLAPSEKEIATVDGRWFLVRIMPYRTLANVIEGVVITFVDITAAKQLENRLREA